MPAVPIMLLFCAYLYMYEKLLCLLGINIAGRYREVTAWLNGERINEILPCLYYYLNRKTL